MKKENYTKRAQVLLTPEQYQLLLLHSRKEHQSVGEVIRQAIQRVIISPEERGERRRAVQELLSGAYDLSEPFDLETWKHEYEKMKGSAAFAEEEKE